MVLVADGCTLACISRGQNVRAQSSTEAEVYIAVMGAAEAMHLQQLLAWAGLPMRMRLHMDSSVGRSALLPPGVGRIRQLEAKVLRIRGMTSGGRLLVDTVRGAENVAEVGTKPFSGPAFVKLRLMLGRMLALTAAS